MNSSTIVEESINNKTDCFYEQNCYELESRCKLCPLKFDGVTCTDNEYIGDNLGTYSQFKYSCQSYDRQSAYSIAKKIANLLIRSDNENAND